MPVIKLESVRLCFADLFTPKAVNGEGDPKFSAVFPIEPGSPNHKLIEAAMIEAASGKWGAKWTAVVAALKLKGRVAFHEGPKTKANGEVYEGFEGMFHITTSSPTRPLVLDRDKTPLTAADGRPYAGCYVNASVEVWAQDNAWGQRVNAKLRGVQFLRHGDAFSGGPAPSEDEFDEIAEGAQAGDLV